MSSSLPASGGGASSPKLGRERGWDRRMVGGWVAGVFHPVSPPSKGGVIVTPSPSTFMEGEGEVDG